MMSDEVPEGSPPEQFVEKISDEGGDVYVAPVLEALRETLRSRSKRTPGAEGSTDAPEEGTPARRTVARS